MLNYPDLMQPDPILDPRDVTEFPATPDSPFTNRVIVRNHRSVFHTYPEGADDLLEDDSSDKPKKKDEAQEDMMTTFALARYYSKLHHTLLMRRRVVHQTGKGKISGFYVIYLLGDGKGLVGYGVGQHREGGKALRAARADALRNLDTVARFEAYCDCPTAPDLSADILEARCAHDLVQILVAAQAETNRRECSLQVYLGRAKFSRHLRPYSATWT